MNNLEIIKISFGLFMLHFLQTVSLMNPKGENVSNTREESMRGVLQRQYEIYLPTFCGSTIQNFPLNGVVLLNLLRVSL